MNITLPDIQIPQVSVPTLVESEKVRLKREIKALLKAKKATLIAHYYVDSDLQALAEQTGGFVGDSLEMARFGARAAEQTLIIAGVKFMGETAKILSPQKRVLMPTLEATCSLDLGCEPLAFEAFCKEHPNRTVVVYANTSAAVKALSDWVVTSSIALDVVAHLKSQGEKILWGPDKHLGSYIKRQTGADLISWPGACVVHDEFKTRALEAMKAQYPDAPVLVHPESPFSVLALADVIGSTSKLLKASQTLPQDKFIVATESGIFYKMQQASPQKTFIQAPTAGNSASCTACGHCPWMKMNALDNLKSALANETGEISLPQALIKAASKPLERMVAFTTSQ